MSYDEWWGFLNSGSSQDGRDNSRTCSPWTFATRANARNTSSLLSLAGPMMTSSFGFVVTSVSCVGSVSKFARDESMTRGKKIGNEIQLKICKER